MTNQTLEPVEVTEAVLDAPEPAVDRRDVVGILGVVSLCVGVGAYSWPAGLIVLGVVLLLVAWFVR